MLPFRFVGRRLPLGPERGSDPLGSSVASVGMGLLRLSRSPSMDPYSEEQVVVDCAGASPPGANGAARPETTKKHSDDEQKPERATSSPGRMTCVWRALHFGTRGIHMPPLRLRGDLINNRVHFMRVELRSPAEMRAQPGDSLQNFNDGERELPGSFLRAGRSRNRT